MAEISTEKNSTIIFPAQFMTTVQEALALLKTDLGVEVTFGVPRRSYIDPFRERRFVSPKWPRTWAMRSVCARNRALNSCPRRAPGPALRAARG